MVFGGISRPLKIGVLGGIGPEATGYFYNRLISRLQSEGLIKSNKDYPHVILNSIPAPELTNEKISEEELEYYIQGLKELDLLKPAFIIMVCNTIHLFYEFLQEKVKTPILNLKYEVERYLIENNIHSTLIIGTRNTINNNLYSFKNIQNIHPNKKEQNILSKAIIDFNKGLNKEEQIKKTKEICLKYLNLGAETVILGCTEFAVMLQNEKFSKVNTIDVLIDAILIKFRECSLVEEPSSPKRKARFRLSAFPLK